jgi:hypothetical protein
VTMSFTAQPDLETMKMTAMAQDLASVSLWSGAVVYIAGQWGRVWHMSIKQLSCLLLTTHDHLSCSKESKTLRRARNQDLM